jgi:hypothetical protein
VGVAGALTASAYFKAGTATYGTITDTTQATRAIFNATTGAFVNWEGTQGTHVFSSQVLPNGWIRVSLSWTATAASGIALGLSMSPTSGSGLNNGKTIHVWGAQVEQASDASSYIPTTTAAVTRNFDQLQYNAAGNVNAAVGSVFAEAMSATATADPTKGIVTLEPAGAYPLANTAAGTITMYDGVATVSAALAVTPNTPYKVGSRWGAAGAQMGILLNGGAIANAAFHSPMPGTKLQIGNWASTVGSGLNGPIKNVKIYNVALTDAQLQALTT